MQNDSNYSSAQLRFEEDARLLESFTLFDALALGQLATSFGVARSLGVAIEVHLGGWVVYHASLPGSSPENDSWLTRKGRVVLESGHSSLHEKVASEELGVNWNEARNLSEDLAAVYGGGVPIHVRGEDHVGTILVSGLTQLDDHFLAVESLQTYIDRSPK